MNTAATIQQNAEDIYAEAQQMNDEREAEEAEEVVSTSDEEDSGTEDKEPEDGEAESEKE